MALLLKSAGSHQPTDEPVLINLTDTVPAFASGQFSQIIDFVPVDEQQKQQARERFKVYRQLGFACRNTENLAATESSSTE